MDRPTASALSVASHRLEGVELDPAIMGVLDRWAAGDLSHNDLVLIENSLLTSESVAVAVEHRTAQAA